MLTSARPVAFVPSSDLDRSRRFYEDTLGLAVGPADGFAVVVDAGGASIRITNVGEGFHVQPFTIVGWEVDDVRAAVAHLVGRGVRFLRVESVEQDEAGVWTAPDGTRVAWFTDPDGNTLSLAGH